MKCSKRSRSPHCNEERFSLKIYVRHPDNLAPFLNIRLDDVGELLRRAADRIVAKGYQMLLGSRERDNLDDLTIEQGGDFVGRSCRDKDAEPALALDARVTGFGHCGHLRPRLQARFAHDR